jgi:hypothetical protein
MLECRRSKHSVISWSPIRQVAPWCDWFMSRRTRRHLPTTLLTMMIIAPNGPSAGLWALGHSLADLSNETHGCLTGGTVMNVAPRPDRPHRRAKLGLVLAAALALTIGPTSVASAEGEPTGPVLRAAPASLEGLKPRVGRPVVGSAGQWVGSGTISYRLDWKTCTPYAPRECSTVATKTTNDAAETLSYTPTAADNLAQRELWFDVTATDANGTVSTDWSWSVGAERRWTQPVDVDQASSSMTTMDDTGATTLITWRQKTSSADRGLYGVQIRPDGSNGDWEPIYISSLPENDPTRPLGIDVDADGRVYLVFLDDTGDLNVTERNPATGAWSTPHQLAAASQLGGHFATQQGEGIVSAAGHGKAAAVWVIPLDDANNKASRIVVATRGASGWTGVTPHVFEQPLATKCESGDMNGWLTSPDQGQIGVAPNGDVTVVWNRFNDTKGCTWDPYQGYVMVDAAYLRGGTWSGVTTLNTWPGFFGYEPKQLAVGAAGAELLFADGGGDDLYLLEAGPGGTFPTFDVETAEPATHLRHWDETTERRDASDLAMSDAGDVHVVWTTYHPGEKTSYSLEAVHGEVGGEMSGPQTVLAPPAPAWQMFDPTVTVAGNGDAALAARGLVPGGSTTPFVATFDQLADRWRTPQTVDFSYVTGGWGRWAPGFRPMVQFDVDGVLRMAAQRYGTERTHTAVTRLGKGSGIPEVALTGLTARPGKQFTLTPLSSSEPDGLALTYTWDLDGDGDFADATGESITTSFPAEGDYPVVVRATASDGEFGVSPATVWVRANSAPSVSVFRTDSGEPTSGSPVTFQAYAYDDADFEGLTYEWSFDGVLAPGETGPTASHTFRSGQHTVSVEVTDAEGASATATLDVVVGGTDPEHTLTVRRDGTGSGSVLASPGISCGTDCTHSYPEGTQVTLVANPASGSAWQKWVGCDDVQTGDCVVTMDEAKTVTATFVPVVAPTRTLTIEKGGTGSGTVTGTGITCGSDCVESLTKDTPVTLTASPAAGSTFKGWLNCPSPQGTTCDLTLDEDRTIGAKFAVTNGAVQTSITSSNIKSKKGRATFGFTGSSPVGGVSFECKLDAKKYQPCTSPRSYSRLGKGSHTFLVRAVDGRGVRDQSPGEVKFQIRR